MLKRQKTNVNIVFVPVTRCLELKQVRFWKNTYFIVLRLDVECRFLCDIFIVICSVNTRGKYIEIHMKHFCIAF